MLPAVARHLAGRTGRSAPLNDPRSPAGLSVRDRTEAPARNTKT
jgi:hypothetical protein